MIALTGVLFVLLLLVCGKHGITIFASLVGSFIGLLAVMMLIADEFNPIVVGLLFSVGLLALAIYPNTKNPHIQHAAFFSSLMVIGALFLVIWGLVHFSYSHGFSVEDTEDIEQFITSVGISFPEIQMVVMLFSSLGAISEASIAISSGVYEILKYDPKIPNNQLFYAGMSIGYKNISTALNTLLFGFFGSYLSLGLWFIQLHYSWHKVINNAIFVSAILELLVSFLGVILVMFVTNLYILGKRKKLA